MPQLTVDEELLRTFLSLQPEDRTEFCVRLEEGHVLFFPSTPFPFPQSDIDFLLERKQTTARYHKNISYRPLQNVIRGVERGDRQKDRLLRVMGDYSRCVRSFLTGFLPPYAATWKLDYASFRPQQEQGRKLKLKARNDLLHVDAFPTRPTRGNRILRFFTNINPTDARRWIVGRPFGEIVEQYVGSGGMPLPSRKESPFRQLVRSFGRRARRFGFPNAGRSRYDSFMLDFHDYLKGNSDFQENSRREQLEFPPGSSWMVFTDLVPHAALAGQYALEQTFIVSRQALLRPELAPIHVLEKLAGLELVD